MKKEDYVLFEKGDGVAAITLNRPDAFNSLHPMLIEQLLSALHMVQNDTETEIVVVTGAGKAFCAGGDLPYMESLDNLTEVRKYINDAASITSAIINLEKPVIAMVNGVAAGGGFNLALACDIIFCAASARFAQSFARIGLVPDCGGTYILPRAVGLHKAKELMFTGDIINADMALQLGLVNRVVEDQKLREETFQFARRLVKMAPVALKTTKSMLNNSLNMNLDAVLEMELNAQTVCLMTEDLKEGVLAFKEKRPAVFKGR